MKTRYLMLSWLIQSIAFSQIPWDAPPPVDWTNAGYRGKSAEIPRQFDRIINVMKEYAVTGDGVTDDAAEIQRAIDEKVANELTVLYFPPGTYHLGTTIHLRSKILILGAGSDFTTFHTTSANHVFEIKGIVMPPVAPAPNPSELFKEAEAITIPFEASPGDFVIIKGVKESLKAAHDELWDGSVGQTVRLALVAGEIAVLEDKLRLDLTTYTDLQIEKLNPVSDVGFENFKVMNDGPVGETNFSENFRFDLAVDCWISGVESRGSGLAHVGIGASANIEIRGSYFHESQHYGIGGHGYGIMIGSYASSCLIEDCEFWWLRHAMILSHSANGNVFGFNFSTGQYSGFEYDNADVTFHGRYSFANLFEGNYTEFARGDDVWGVNGPDNTLFRNHFQKAPTLICGVPTLDGGIRIDHIAGYAQRFYVLGNKVRSTTGPNDCCKAFYFDPVDIAQRSGNFGDEGLNCSIIMFADGKERTSLYKESRPAFIPSNYSWPPLGCKHYGATPTDNIPAKDRWYGTGSKTLELPMVDGLIRVAIENDLNGTKSAGNVGLLEKTGENSKWSSTSSPGVFYAAPGTNQTARTESHHLSFGNGDWRHRNWNNILSQTSLEYSFLSSVGITNSAFFNPAHPLTLQSIFLETGAHGKVTFRGSEKTSPYNDFGFMSPYSTSIGVPNPQSEPSGGTANFAFWSDGIPAIDREVSLTAPTTLTATLKYGRKSTVISAVGPGNERRLVKDASGKYHSVYESANLVWHVTSTNGGSSWTQDVTYAPNASCSEPSIACSRDVWLNDLFIMWQENAGNGKTLRLRKSSNYLGTSIEQLDSDPSVPDMQPAIAVSNDGMMILIVYKKVISGTNRLCYLFSDAAGEYFYGGPMTVGGGMPITFDNPSLSWSESAYKFYLSCNNGSQVLLYNFNGSSWVYDGLVWSGTVSSPSQVSVDGTGRLYVSWVGIGSWYDQAVLVRSRSGAGSWSSVTEIYSDLVPPMTYSTISANAASAGATLFALDEGVLWNMMTADGLNWTNKSWSQYYPIRAHNPNLADRNEPTAMASTMSRASGSLYDIVFEVRNNMGSGLPKSSGDEVVESINSTVRQYRAAELQDTTFGGRLLFALGDIVISSNDGSETSVIGFAASTPDSTLQVGKSNTFSFESESNVAVDITLDSREWKSGGRFVLELFESGSGRVLKTLEDIPVSETADVRQRRVHYLSSGSRNCLLRATIVDVDRRNTTVRQINILRMDAEANLPKGPGLPESNEVRFLPEKTDLLQNYPNPFNAETRIEYQLKEPATVDLKVFDMLGREISVLTDGFREAGFHSVLWNAEKFAAGIYLLRISVSGHNAPRYTAIRKLLLTK